MSLFLLIFVKNGFDVNLITFNVCMCGLSPMAVFYCSIPYLRTPPDIFLKQVFKGLNESTGELFAVKQIELAHGSKEEMNTLETEIDLMKDLNHRYRPHERPQSQATYQAPHTGRNYLGRVPPGSTNLKNSPCCPEM